jgi:uncharacterized protein YbjQ (UPF0145 family)
MSEQNQCPNCATKLRGMIKIYSMIDKRSLKIINLILNTNETQLCSKCVVPFIEKAKDRVSAEKSLREQELRKGLSKLPVATIHIPPKWDFEILGIVTGQSVTGTGVFAELFSEFTDFFGAQSETYNNKLRQGELLCLSQIKTKTLELGGNAIVGVDIDYSEVGGGKGMLMVCMAGTAINLKNIDEVQPEIGEAISLARNANETLALFAKFNKEVLSTANSF